MVNPMNPNRPGFSRPGQRKTIRVSGDALVTTEMLDAGAGSLLTLRPAVDGLDLGEWSRVNQAVIRQHLTTRGAILFRGFKVRSAEQFEQYLGAAAGDLIDYTYGSTPRSRVSGKVYTSTEYPADEHIPLHNEMAYTTEWPMKIWFFCLSPAAEGGETPIADSRRVLARIPAEIRERFERKLVMYVRNYENRLDVPWQTVFQTADRSAVEDYCRRAGIEWEWKGSDGLHTRQVCQATAAHPQTGEEVWFNQAHLFHVSALKRETREALLSLYGERGLSRHTYYGDGSPIETSDLDVIRECYREETLAWPWQAGDILMLDNMLTAHGRRPYTGARRILVGMAESSGGREL
jgi:alpha-ketoglutarate-dependent taurine dioxygenase